MQDEGPFCIPGGKQALKGLKKLGARAFLGLKIIYLRYTYLHLNHKKTSDASKALLFSSPAVWSWG
ncbi:hypothetical protein ADICEAN_02257 [Cesiribacter andamanensis AMV16]|uniref:Uncharacterized protein n=1 Tax=Cesiribacter andamanensis AMV16 TaxID=1279009 RepID=M7N5T8_9BACT|nr:hypothetical protein ADICEAN_02257 [Cesiribacter andamanensis AMV16]